jgi:hypothetical protein
MTKTGLFIILARNAPVGVIFRRGPTKQVQLIKWNLKDDSFELGQWLKGRIYERRCDLSPNGEKLIYFAANYRRNGPRTWTAVSNPPYLTALAMWPKGDAWGGGGLFDSEYTISLNHRSNERELADGFQLGKDMKIRPFGARPGWGEDDPIYHSRLLRDGWILKQEGKWTEYQKSGTRWRFIEPQIYEKRLSIKKGVFFLQMQLKGIGEYEGDWYALDYEIIDDKGNSLLKISHISWADWCDGDLLFAKEGKLYRLCRIKNAGWNMDNARELADFSAQQFTPMKAPQKALKW